VAGAVSLVFAAFSGWVATRWLPAMIPAFLFLVSCGIVVFLATRPTIELHNTHIAIGDRKISWKKIRRVDTTGWVSPLVVLHLSLADNSRVTVIYPGDAEAAQNLHRQIRRGAREALIDGLPYREYWGEPVKAPDRRTLPSPKYRVLRPEDEAEVEQLYLRLKKVGNLDSSSSDDERS
jgi:hypothetical protein